jgi:site-specific recombinase XerC
MTMQDANSTLPQPKRTPWNKGKLIGAKPNLRAVQLLLGHSKLEGTVRYLGIEVDDALAIAEQVEV